MKENNKVLITAVVLILLFGGILFIFNKQGYLSFKGKETTIVNNVDNNTLDKNTGNYIDLAKLSEFKNYDGTYGTMASLRLIPEDHAYDYNISLSLDGKVRVYNFDTGEGHDINISNVTQIGHADAVSFYLLDNSNQVYVYELANFAKSNYNVTKLDGANNVIRLISIQYGPIANAGGASAVIGIKPDGSYINLDSFRR